MLELGENKDILLYYHNCILKWSQTDWELA